MTEFDTPETDDSEFVETYVDVVDNRKRVILLLVALLVLIALLGVLAPYLYDAIKPKGPTAAGRLDKGMTWVRSIYGWGKTEDQILRMPTDVAIAPNGTIWTISNHETIVGFDQNGRAVQLLTPPRGGAPGQFESLESLDVDEHGDLWVVDYGNAKVMKVTPDKGNVLLEIPVPFAQEVAVQNGVVAVAASPGVAIFDDTGRLIREIGGRGTGPLQFDNARGVAFGSDGTLFVTDAYNRRVKAFAKDGKLLWTFPDEKAVAAGRKAAQLPPEQRAEAQKSLPFELPVGATVDAAGRIVLVDSFGLRIMALDPRNGSELARWGKEGSLDGELAYPTGIDYDPARDIYAVADTANNRLQIFTLEGSGGGVISRATRLADGPIWICCLPLLLLLVLVVLTVLASRRRREARVEEQGAAVSVE